MTSIWIPDTCPSGSRPCELETDLDPSKPNDGGQGRLVREINICPYHSKIKLDHNIDNHGLLDALKQTSRVKESARLAVAKSLGIEHSHDIPFVVASDGTIKVGQNNFGVSDKITTATPAAKLAVKDNVVTSLKSVRQPAGTSKIEIVGLN